MFESYIQHQHDLLRVSASAARRVALGSLLYVTTAPVYNMSNNGDDKKYLAGRRTHLVPPSTFTRRVQYDSSFNNLQVW